MALSRGSRSFRGRTSSPRRKTSWEESVGQSATQTSISASGKLLMAAGAVVLEDGITLVRTRGEFVAFLSASSAVTSGMFGALGIGVGTSTAFVAGAASLPGPITEMDWDGWLYHRILSFTSGVAIAGSVASDLNVMGTVLSCIRLEIDSKAMRKLRIGDTIFAMLEVSEVGTAVLQSNINTRSLFKLP